MTDKFNSYDWLWLSLTLFPILLIALLLPLSPQDYWWYLRLGSDILQMGEIPSVNTYSYTREGVSFFYQAWLAAVLFWKTYMAGGITLTFFLRGLVIATTYGLLWIMVRSMDAGPRLASLLTLLASLVGSGNWSFRPQMLTYPLFVFSLFILMRWAHGKTRGVWILPPLSVLWVNLHGSFPLLLVLGCLALAFGKGDRRRLGIAMGLATLAMLVNPHGVNVLGYVRNMLTSQSNQLSIEWGPTINRGWQANLFFAWVLTLAPLAAISERKRPLLDWTYFLTFGWLALYGVRYVIWFSFILALQTGALLAEIGNRFIEASPQRERRSVNNLVAVLLLVLPFATLPGFRESWWPGAPTPYDHTNPIDATNWLEAKPELAGPLFSDLSHASYLIFALPSRPVWIDPRFELYPTSQWVRYSSIMSASPNWQGLLDEEGINLVMLSTNGEPALIAAMRASDQWCQGYQGQNAVVFYRKGVCP
jgi:hypothetical protein